MLTNKLSRLALVLLCVVSLPACVIEVNADGGRYNKSRVFGSIETREGEHVGDLESVNGSIRLRDETHADSVETVNGSVRIEDDVMVASVETVNGSVSAGRNFRSSGGVSTVNGRIEMKSGGVVKRDVSTVNGRIELASTEVEGDVQTTNGDIMLEHSTVGGDVVFSDPGRHNSWHDHDEPRLVIDAQSTVRGTIHLYQRVTLDIEDGAQINEIVRHYAGRE